MRGVFYFQRKDEAIFFLNYLLHSRKRISRVPGDALQKYTLWLDRTYHHGVTLLGIFSRSFSDRANVLLPRQRTLSGTIALGLIFPDVTPKRTRARAHLKSMTCAKHFPHLNIIWMHDQYAFGQFRIISTSRPLAC